MAGRGSRNADEEPPVQMKNEEEGEMTMVVKAKKWIEERGQKATSTQIELRTLCDIQVLQVQRGWILCNLKLHPNSADQNGNCHSGAIATIIDVVGATAISTYAGDIKVSLHYNISYFSTVKIQEEVEIEGKVIENRGKLSLTIVEFRRKEDGVLLALGKQWMSRLTAAGPIIRTRI